VFIRKLLILKCLLRKRQEQGLRTSAAALERQRKTPKNGSLLLVNDHFWGERNAVIGVFLETLVNNSFTCAIVHLELRRILTKKFQHALFYNIYEDKKQVIIIAVLHTSQNPEIWKQLAK